MAKRAHAAPKQSGNKRGKTEHADATKWFDLEDDPQPEIAESGSGAAYWEAFRMRHALDLMCVVCQEPLLDAYVFHCCGQSLCGFCLKALRKDQCPCCRQPVERIDMLRPSRALNALLAFYFGPGLEQQRAERKQRLDEATRLHALGERYLESQRYESIAGIMSMEAMQLCVASAWSCCKVSAVLKQTRRIVRAQASIGEVSLEELQFVMQNALDDRFEVRNGTLFHFVYAPLQPILTERGAFPISEMKSWIMGSMLAQCDLEEVSRDIVSRFLQENGAPSEVVLDAKHAVLGADPRKIEIQKAAAFASALTEEQLAPDTSSQTD